MHALDNTDREGNLANHSDNQTSNCPICHATGQKWFVAQDRHYGNSGYWALHRCPKCLHAYQWPLPTDSQLRNFYPKTYYAYCRPRLIAPSVPESIGLRLRYQYLKFAKKYWHLNVRYNPLGILIGKRLFRKPLALQTPEYRPGGRVLDFGCGSGSFVAFLQAIGWQAEGIEIDENAARAGCDAGLPILCGSTDQLETRTDHYDHIMAFHSLEHVVDIHRFFRAAHSALKLGGTLRVDVPNGNSLALELFHGNAFYVTLPVHVHLFSPESLRAALVAAHFHNVQIKTFNVPETWPASWCLSKLAKHRGTRSFDAVRRAELWLGRIATTINRIRARLHNRGDCIAAIATR